MRGSLRRRARLGGVLGVRGGVTRRLPSNLVRFTLNTCICMYREVFECIEYVFSEVFKNMEIHVFAVPIRNDTRPRYACYADTCIAF